MKSTRSIELLGVTSMKLFGWTSLDGAFIPAITRAAGGTRESSLGSGETADTEAALKNTRRTTTRSSVQVHRRIRRLRFPRLPDLLGFPLDSRIECGKRRL